MNEGSARCFFYEEDLVTLLGDTSERVATVIRTWHEDSEDDDDDDICLAKDQYLIEWLPSRRQTVDGRDLLLKDRSFQIGDICKKMKQGTISTISGVVTDVRMEVQLQSISSSSKRTDWTATTLLSKTACIEEGDHVFHKNWVGIVELVFEEALLTVRGNNRPYKIFCVEGGLKYGHPSESLLDSMQGVITGKTLGTHITPTNSRVVAIRQTAVFVTWLAVNQKLSPQEEDLYPEPEAIWTDLEELLVVRHHEEHKYALGDSVYVAKTEETGNTSMSCYNDDEAQQVYNTRSEVEVLWQDGTRTWQLSTTLEQSTVEDHQVWPGDHLIYRDAEGKEVGAVVQSMDQSEQTVCITVYGNDDMEAKTVSALDCKLEGSPDFSLGLNRGDIVLISASDTGYIAPSVARLGMLAPGDMDEEEQEESLITVGREIARRSSRAQLSTQKQPRRAHDAHDIDWYGIIEDCVSNGRITVELPDGRRVEERVERLSILVDGFGDVEAASCDGSGWESTSEADSIGWISQDGNVSDPEAEKETAAAANGAEVPKMTQSAILPEEADFSPFQMVDHAPNDHAFLKQSHIVHHQKSFLSRVQREHRILSSSLPDTILVRTYEDRLDLLRAIIIGSQDTPYEDAPILFDLYLKPSFPSEPPLVYFHSWSRGLGRINPHLYEDGSVCLSLLNTWQGDKTEAWNPAKSTLLQVLVSIQGLVLIAEPGLETEQIDVSQQSNLLYSEKAYILSRHFIVQALQKGVQGFESDLQFVYGTKGRLSSSIRKARMLVDQASDPAQGTMPLTKGGIIALRRVLEDMERLNL